MGILVSKLKSDLRPWALSTIPPDLLDTLQDSDFVATFNAVARDINDVAQVRTERYYKKCNSDNAEDANLTNFLLQGVINKVYKVIYYDDSAPDQYYTYTADRFILKVAAVEDTWLEVDYLRDIEEVTISDTDEIDLPDTCYHEYLTLVKERIAFDYSLRDGANYEVKLNSAAVILRRKVSQPLNKGKVADSWYGLDNRYYDITDRYLGMENFAADISGDYSHVDA